MLFPHRFLDPPTSSDPRARQQTPGKRWRADLVLTAVIAVALAASCGRGSERISRQEARTAATEVQGSRAAPAMNSVPLRERMEEGDVEAPPPYFAELQRRALELANQPARPRRLVQLPENLKAIDYDAYRSIRFRPERSLWRDDPGNFEVQFFHPGFYYGDAVSVWQLRPDQSEVQPIAFSRDWFNYGQVSPPPAAAELAFTGFRIHAPINTPEYKDEVVVFQGASYFRPLGKGNVYGLSARALAIDMGEASGEEFPRFTEFFLVRPSANDRAMWVLGLLESERATGAYAFRVKPGAPTLLEVTAEIFLRGTPGVIGLAPLSSMYLFGEESPGRFRDFRPEVHDSDGVLLGSKSGEWLFRPLTNPERTRVSSMRLDAPVGFGLLQRDRRFESYQDLEARHEARPSVWIQPISGFDKGNLRLLEIATRLETDDNIAVAWVPDDSSSEQLSLRYRMRVGANVGELHAGGTVAATRILPEEKGNLRFLVDFAGKQLIGKQTEAVVSAQGGRVIEQHVENNPHLPGVRASFLIQPAPEARDIELRAFLQRSGDALTETWSYLWQDRD